MAQYGDLYGSSLYGPDLASSSTSAAVRKAVGKTYDIALAGVGLMLAPGQKAYSKKAAQTFSYNVRSLFSSSTRLTARDLYFWNRLEHIRWDKGETYEVWAPDSTTPTGLPSSYYTSTGFDTSQPHKLVHLKEIKHTQTYVDRVIADGATHFWPLNDNLGNTTLANLVTPSVPLTLGGVLGGSTALYKDTSTSHVSPGADIRLYDDTEGQDIGVTTLVHQDPFNNINAIILGNGLSLASNVITAASGGVAFGVFGHPDWDLALTYQLRFQFFTNSQPSVLSRWVDASNNIFARADGTNLVLWKQVGGTYTNLANTATVALTDSTWYWFRVTITGTNHQIQVFQDSAGTISATQVGATISGSVADSVLASGRMGFGNALFGACTATCKFGGAFTSVCIVWQDQPYQVQGYAAGGISGAGTDACSYAYSSAQSIDGHSLSIYNPTGSSWGFYQYGYTSNPGVSMRATMWTKGPAGQAYDGQFYAFGGVPNVGNFANPGILYTGGWQFVDFTYTPGGNPNESTALRVQAANGGTAFPGVYYFDDIMITTASNPQVFGQAGMSQSTKQGALPGTFSMECWVRPRTLPQSAYFEGQFITYTGQTQNGGTGISLGIGDNTGFRGTHLIIEINGISWFDSGYIFPTENIWYHVVITRDGTTLKCYVNGVQTPNTTTNTPNAGVSNQFTVGGSKTSLRFFNGEVYGFAYYLTTLSLATIQAHYNLGSNNANGAAQITPTTQTYAQFIETYDGKLYINQQNTNLKYTTDGGATWSSVALGSDVTTIGAIWSDGPKAYAATANDVFYGDSTGMAVTWRGANPAIAGVTAGWYDGAQIYVGIGTSFYYVDPATGIKTQLYDTKNFSIKWIRGFNNKVWFGGTANTGGRFTRIWTWTNTTLPPSPSNGVGAQVTDGSLPAGFITTAALVYQSLLIIGGFFPYTSGQTNDGVGAAYYVNASNTIGQLFIVGTNTAGRSYQINGMWGDNNFVYCNYSHKLGLGRYDLSKGAFSTAHTTTLYADTSSNQVLAVAVHKSRRLFALQNDGTIWREQVNPVPTATLQESEFDELMFLPKIIDAAEGSHKALLTGQSISVDISSDFGTTWSNKGINLQPGLDHFEFKQVNLQLNHWTSRLTSIVGQDATVSPEVYNWSWRFSPLISPKHEWIVECLMPRAARFRDNSVLYDVDLNKIKTLWSARENGTVVEFVDRDLQVFKVLILEMEEIKATDRMVKAQSQQSRDVIVKLELLEVSNA